MRHLLSTLISFIVYCIALGCCGCASSVANIGKVHCDTVVISCIPDHGSFTTEDREDFPPEFTTVEYGEIIDSAFFFMLKNLAKFKCIDDVVEVNFYTCDWDQLNRIERFRNNPTSNQTWIEELSLTLPIFNPLTSLKKRDEEYFINITNNELRDVLRYNHTPRVLVMVDSIPMVLPKYFEGELFKPNGTITYKYTSNYMKYLWDHRWELLEIGDVGTYFQVKDGKITRIPYNSTIMHILTE